VNHSHDEIAWQWGEGYEHLEPLANWIMPLCPFSTDPSMGCYWEVSSTDQTARFVEFRPHGGTPVSR
jgi:hypothetical protein